MRSALNVLLGLALKSNGLDYVTNENLTELFLNPLSLLALLALVGLFCAFLYFQMIALFLYFHDTNQGKRISIKKLLSLSFKKIKRLSFSSHLCLIFYTLLFIPILGIPFNTLFLRGIRIPDFIMDFINQNTGFIIFYYILRALLFLIFLFSIFIPYEIIVNEAKKREALRISMERVKDNFLKIFLLFIIWNLLLFSLCYLFYLGVALVSVIFIKMEGGGVGEFWFYFKRIEAVYYTLLKPIVIVSGNIGLISVFSPDAKNLPLLYKDIVSKSIVLEKIVKVGALFLVLVFTIEFVDRSVYENYISDQIEVVCHRAGGILAPENTLAGLREAISAHSGYAEIDVRQTADGVLVLSHDSSLKRITGINKDISDVTYQELQTYDAGRYFGAQFQGEKIPTLQEILSEAKGKIKLLIELKKGRKDEELIDKTLSLIHAEDMEEDCIIASLSLDILKAVEMKRPSIVTAYLVMMAYGDLLSLGTNVDILAIEPTFASKKLLRELKANGKKIFVWTVNKEETLSKAIKLPIDGIITDDPYTARYVLDTRGIDPVVMVLMKKLLFAESH